MDGDAENTPSDAGIEIEQAAIDEIASGLSDALRAVRGVSARLRQARPIERSNIVAGAYDASRDLRKVIERQTALLERLARAEAPTVPELKAMGNEITPDTHVRMSTAKFLGVIGAIVAIVSGGVAAWFGVGEAMRRVTNDLSVHVSDTDVHIDKAYQKDHGRPVGRWDLDAYKAETGRKLDAHDEKLDRILNLLVNPKPRRGQ